MKGPEDAPIKPVKTSFRVHEVTMILEVWYDYVDDDRESVIYKQPATLMMRIPRIGEKISIAPRWQDDLAYVVDIRHFFVDPDDGPEKQEIHIMCSRTR